MAFNRRVLCLLALLPATGVAQSSQDDPFPIEIFESAPAPAQAGPFEAAPLESRQNNSSTGEGRSFEPQFSSGASESRTAETAGAVPLTVNDVADINPYAASVPVRSRFPEDRADALQEALALVLIRLTGKTGDVTEDQRRLITRAPQLVQQYRYETPPPSADGFGPRPSQLRLRAEFSPSVMRREIQLAGLPWVTTDRPATLLWPLRQTDAGWQLLSSNSPLREQWRQQASDRGFTLFIASGDLPAGLSALPLVELDEQLRSLGESLVAGEHEPVRVAVAPGIAQRWSELAGLQRRWVARDGSEGADGMATLLDGYAERSTETVAVGPSVQISISNINSLAKYAALQRYFQQLEQVQRQQLYAAAGDSVTLSLKLRGDTALLRSALALNNTLQVDGTFGDGALRYRWSGN